jgi:hypothetical protein
MEVISKLRVMAYDLPFVNDGTGASRCSRLVTRYSFAHVWPDANRGYRESEVRALQLRQALGGSRHSENAPTELPCRTFLRVDDMDGGESKRVYGK